MLKKSLTMQYMGTILGMVAGTVLLCWFLNTTFLEYYYTYNKQKAMLEGFSTIDGESRQDTMESAGFDVEFERICSDGNISILIISADGSIVRTSADNQKAVYGRAFWKL